MDDEQMRQQRAERGLEEYRLRAYKVEGRVVGTAEKGVTLVLITIRGSFITCIRYYVSPF